MPEIKREFPRFGVTLNPALTKLHKSVPVAVARRVSTRRVKDGRVVLVWLRRGFPASVRELRMRGAAPPAATQDGEQVLTLQLRVLTGWDTLALIALLLAVGLSGWLYSG